MKKKNVSHESVPRFRSNLNLEMLVFDERGKPKDWEKHFSQQGPVYRKSR